MKKSRSFQNVDIFSELDRCTPCVFIGTVARFSRNKSLLISFGAPVVELTNSKDILKEIENHFSQKFKNKSNHTEQECLDFLQDINLPKLDDEEASLMGRKVSTGEVLEVLHSMPSGKTPGNDGLSKEFFLAFFNIINEDLINSYNASFDNGQLTSSQRKAVITLIQKPDKDSRKLNGWRPISLMNVDTKILSKIMVKRMVRSLPKLVHPDQSAFVKGRFIGESLRLISDILEYTKELDKPGILFGADFESAFDSVGHTFLYSV